MTLFLAFVQHGKNEQDFHYGSLVVEQQSNENGAVLDAKNNAIVGCFLYSEMYHFLFGMAYYIHGLSVHPNHQGNYEKCL